MKRTVTLGFVLSFMASAAFAQAQTTTPASTAPAPAKAASSTQIMPAIPKMAAAPAAPQSYGKKSSSSKKADAKKKNYHWCTRDDIMGVWKVVYFQESPEGQQTAVFRTLPNQYFIFTDNNMFVFFNSNEPVNTKGLRDMVNNTTAGKGYSFILGQNGNLQLRLQDGKNFDKLWCQVVPKTGAGYQKGDLITTHASTGSSEESVGQMVRVFRKIPM